MGSIFSFLPGPKLLESTDRATETDWNCPICRDSRDDLTYVTPCLHQFCLGCIMRWAEIQIVCPLCRELIETVRFSVQPDSYIDCVFTAPEDAGSWAGITLGQLARNNPHQFVTSPSRSPQGILPTAEQEGAGTEHLGGLLPRVWAELFQREEHLLDPVVLWLRQELDAIYGARWWMARIAESIILHAVSICGPVANVLVQVLEDFLEEHTEPLVHGMINIIGGECTEEAHRLLCSRALPVENSPTSRSNSIHHPNSASSPATRSTPDHPTTPGGVLHSPRPSAPVPAEQEAAEEELREQEAAEPGRAEENRLVAFSRSPQGGIPALQPAPASSSPAGSNVENQLSTSELVLHIPQPSAPIPAEELEQAEEASPSAQGSHHSPSTHRRDTDPLPRRPRRSRRRRAASSPQSRKRPPHHQ